MNESKHPRAVIGLVILAILCTVALGMREQRSAPLAAYSPLSPLGTGPRTLPGMGDQAPQGAQGMRSGLDPMARLGTLRRLGTLPAQRWLKSIGTRVFWLEPWPWIVVGLAGFGLLAWGLFWGMRRMERN